MKNLTQRLVSQDAIYNVVEGVVPDFVNWLNKAHCGNCPARNSGECDFVPEATAFSIVEDSVFIQVAFDNHEVYKWYELDELCLALSVLTYKLTGEDNFELAREVDECGY